MTDENGFTLHGLDRISVSQANQFREDASGWAVKVLHKVKFPVGWAAWQGKAVEAGVDAGLYDMIDAVDCAEIAIERLKLEGIMAPNKAAELEKRIPIVKRMVEIALEQLLPLGEPDRPPEGDRQWEVNVPIRFKSGQAGIIGNKGFLDYKYTITPEMRRKMDGLDDFDQLVVDLKTTSKAPSEWTIGHGIQASVYEQSVALENPCIGGSGNRVQVRFLYALTRQKNPFLWLTMENSEDYIEILKRTIRQMDALLSLSADKDKLLAAIPHNPEHYYWSNAQEISAQYYG